VGFLLNEKGQPRIALQYFALALQADPALTPARRMFDALQQQLGRGRAAQSVDAGVTVGVPAAAAAEEPPMVTQEPLRVSQAAAPMPPNSLLTQRLPPTNAFGVAASAASDPPGRSPSDGRDIAPLPPATASRSSGNASPDLR
jgi:hypothetical protein